MNMYMDHHNWLVSNNLLTDKMKDDVAMAGYFIVEEVIEVGPSIDFNNKTVYYGLVVPDRLYDNLKLLEKFKNGEKVGLFKSIRLKKFLNKKTENDDSGMGYDLEKIANTFVKNYLNQEWSAKVQLFKEENRNEMDDFILRSEGNLQSD